MSPRPTRLVFLPPGIFNLNPTVKEDPMSKKMIPVPQFGGSIGDLVAWIFEDVMGQATQSISGGLCRDELSYLGMGFRSG